MPTKPQKPHKTPRSNDLDNFTFHLIDKHKLDEEWIDHVDAVHQFGQKLAKAKLAYEQTKAATAVFEAETSRRVRSKPKTYSVNRLTEAAIKEAVTIELLYSTEHDNLLRAKYKVDMLEATMRTLEHRKRALSDLVFLHNQDYFSQPKIPKGMNEKMRVNINKQKDRQIRGLDDED